ncbi:Clathrin interactor EPSIN 2 [Abeliophyllum distichum]|uniref:Clathrin interactor EPSIN 2 n=1 Tax=Abeliophyllum distichum TaxID=126358 RepID=A0ABD1Q233_9LAMI
MKKAFDQTVRDIKREVNKKVLKVPSVERKVLDATSNEAWGPHGSLLADIAQASRNYHDYQMIMAVIWKRINDTGKNWRHVYKALTVLEYMVAHGSERVIDEIREHAYQISTLSDFQYIDSSGRDQGNNVRKKSQSLVSLVNDKERIQEVRQKAAANRDKYRNTSMGSQPGSYSSLVGYGDRYDDEGRYGSRNDDRNGSERETESSYRDDDRYGRYGDSNGREGEGYRDDDYRGRSRGIDDYQYGSRSRSADRDTDRAYEDDGQYSSRGRSIERKYSEPNLGAPRYEDAVGAVSSPTRIERNGETSLASAPKSSSPPASANPSHGTTAAARPPVPASPAAQAPAPAPANEKEVNGFDEFDPRGSFSAVPAKSNDAPTASGVAEVDLLGSLSEPFSSNALALVPAASATTNSEANVSGNSSSAPASAGILPPSTITNQPFDDPFGDGPFKAIPSQDSLPAQQQIITSPSPFNSSSSHSSDQPQPVPRKETTEFSGTFPGATNMPSDPSAMQPPTNAQSSQQEVSTIDILADILPQSQSSPFVNSQTSYPVPARQPVPQTGFSPQSNQLALQSGFPYLTGQTAPQTGFQAQASQPAGFPAQQGQPSSQMGFSTQSSQPASVGGFPPQMHPSGTSFQAPLSGQSVQLNSNIYGGYRPQSISPGPAAVQMVPQISSGPVPQNSFASQSGSATLPAVMGSSALVPQPSKDKFETKSTVWADTLSRGLVNLNISGSKTNPLADIGVDFDALNRKERMEKPTTTTAASNVTMGKAMGSGSGIGRAGALRPPSNPTTGSGVGMGGYGGANQPGSIGIGMGMGMGMNMQGNMAMGMNMGTSRGVHMQQQTGFPPGSTMSGVYNPMMGRGNYGQQPYGGGYR